MKIAIGCDHGGYLLKQDILIWLEENDYVKSSAWR